MQLAAESASLPATVLRARSRRPSASGRTKVRRVRKGEEPSRGAPGSGARRNGAARQACLPSLLPAEFTAWERSKFHGSYPCCCRLVPSQLSGEAIALAFSLRVSENANACRTQRRREVQSAAPSLLLLLPWGRRRCSPAPALTSTAVLHESSCWRLPRELRARKHSRASVLEERRRAAA